MLVGGEEELRALLADHGVDLPVVDASEVVGMREDPALTLRARPHASVRVAAELVATGRASALLSAGSTGATLAAALLALGRAGGVRRPAVAARLPVAGGVAVLVDAGASADAQPDALVAHARMGSAYAEVLGIQRPRIGLLNVGHEPGKGNALARVAFDLLGALPGFAGNVEPEAVFSGAVDVVVTDGFTGNILLKTMEALGRRVGAHGDAAAVLLGVDGTVLVTHGAADADAIAAALAHAADCAAGDLARRVAARLEAAEVVG